jgi:hypothetical protein
MNHSSHGLSAVPPPGHADGLRIEILKGNNFAWPINALAVEIPLLSNMRSTNPGIARGQSDGQSGRGI